MDTFGKNMAFIYSKLYLAERKYRKLLSNDAEKLFPPATFSVNLHCQGIANQIQLYLEQIILTSVLPGFKCSIYRTNKHKGRPNCFTFYHKRLNGHCASHVIVTVIELTEWEAWPGAISKHILLLNLWRGKHFCIDFLMCLLATICLKFVC